MFLRSLNQELLECGNNFRIKSAKKVHNHISRKLYRTTPGYLYPTLCGRLSLRAKVCDGIADNKEFSKGRLCCQQARKLDRLDQIGSIIRHLIRILRKRKLSTRNFCKKLITFNASGLVVMFVC